MEELDEEFIATEQSQTYTMSYFFSHVWTRPHQVFQALSSASVFWQLLLLNLVISLLVGINRSSSVRYLFAGDYNLFNGFEVIKYAAIYLGILYLMVTMIRWTGSWLGGEATWNRQAEAYIISNMPILISSIAISIKFYFFIRTEPQVDSHNTEAIVHSNLFFVIKYLKLAINLWCIVLHVISLSIIQKFSYPRALVNLLLAAFFTVIPLIMISYTGLI